LTNRKATLVGNYGSGNRLVISDGGSVFTPTNSFIGYQTNSSNNSVLVTGAGSLWSNSNLYVGYQGMSSSLIISHGGTVVATNSFIGYETNSTNNSVLVTGVGSLWSNSGTITIGTTNGGGGNSLTINNGGLVLASGGINMQSGTLGGDGTVGTATTIGSGVNLIPGSSISGSLTFTQGLVLQSGSTTTFQINTKTDFTSINMVGSSITYGGNLVFNILNYTPATGDVFTLVNMTEGAFESGNFNSVTAGSLIFIDNGGIWTANDGSYLYQFSDSTGQLTVQAVTTFASWSDNAAVTSDLLSRYAFGAADKNSAPETMTTSITSAKLSLTAVVRIDDSSLTVVGETGVDLVGWSSDRVSMVPSSNQTNVPSGCQRRVFSVEITSSTPRQFLRLRANR
jgi:T5SS/PEP-CTERM-associated repeat protein